MAIEHVNIPSAGCHEPKHITDALVTDAGKVITPSDTSAGQSVLRHLVPEDLRGGGNTAGVPLVSDGAGSFVLGTNGDTGPQYGGLTVTNNSTVIATTAAADPTFQTGSDYVQIELFDSPAISPFKGITQAADTLVVAVDGVYNIQFWANINSSSNSDLIAFVFGVNGTVSTARPVVGRVPNNTEPVEVGAHALVELAAGDVVSMWVASKLTSNVTVVNGRVTLTLVDRV